MQPDAQPSSNASLDFSGYWDESTTARYLGLTMKALQQDRYRNRLIPFHRIGSRIRYRAEDIRAFADRCKVA